MSIHSRLFAAALVAGAAGLLVLARVNAQETPAPARRATSAASTIRVPVQFPRTVAEGGGFRTEYREEQHFAYTPELQQLQAAELEAASDAKSFSEQIANTSSDSEREGLKTKLRDALVRQFDAQQQRRSEEIASIEERLGKLKETLQKRGAAKDAIVGKRLDQLMGIKDDLAWEETRIAPPVSVRQLPNVRYPPNSTTEPGNPYSPIPPQFHSPGVPSTPVPAITPQPVGPSPRPVPAPAAAVPATPAPPAPAAAPTAPAPPTF